VNATVPVGTAPLAPDTVAVKRTFAPTRAGFWLERIAVLVA